MMLDRMIALATELAEANELDFSLASLEKLEAIVAAADKRIARDTTTAWGAYLGETIRRLAPVPIDWVDHATASAANTAIVHGAAPMHPAVNALANRDDGLGAEPLARLRETSQ